MILCWKKWKPWKGVLKRRDSNWMTSLVSWLSLLTDVLFTNMFLIVCSFYRFPALGSNGADEHEAPPCSQGSPSQGFVCWLVLRQEAHCFFFSGLLFVCKHWFYFHVHISREKCFLLHLSRMEKSSFGMHSLRIKNMQWPCPPRGSWLVLLHLPETWLHVGLCFHLSKSHLQLLSQLHAYMYF